MDGKVSIRLINRNGNKMRNFLKLFTINILVFLGLLLALNFATILLYQGYNWLKSEINENAVGDLRGRLPN